MPPIHPFAYPPPAPLTRSSTAAFREKTHVVGIAVAVVAVGLAVLLVFIGG